MPQYVVLNLSHARDMDRKEALVELARRYFTSRGLATIEDFTWWSGLPASEARTGLEEVRKSFETCAAENGQIVNPAKLRRKSGI
jgi:hypothetical protein